MFRLLGIPVSDDDCRHLIATLLVEGTPDALSAAAMITKGVDRDLYAVGLSRPERTAVLACLEDPPAGLVELCGVLMREDELWRRYGHSCAASSCCENVSC